MKTVDRQSFAKAMSERGYTLEDIAACIVAETENEITFDEGHPAYPRNRKLGLGDMVAAGLSAVGITPERVSKALGRPCGCKERQAKLNGLGRRFGIG